MEVAVINFKKLQKQDVSVLAYFLMDTFRAIHLKWMSYLFSCLP